MIENVEIVFQIIKFRTLNIRPMSVKKAIQIGLKKPWEREKSIIVNFIDFFLLSFYEYVEEIRPENFLSFLFQF